MTSTASSVVGSAGGRNRMPVWMAVPAIAGVREDAVEHQVVEGDLEPVLDLGLGGRLHVRDQGVEPPVAVPLQPDQVHVAADEPRPERGLQPGLEQDDRLARA